MTALVPIQEQAREYLRQAKAANTVRAYRSDFSDFTSWCAGADVTALPATAETVTLYLSHVAASHKVATVQRRVSAISQAHQAAGFEPPTKSALVRTLLAGIRRVKGVEQVGKEPVLVEELRAMVDGASPRDRALLLVGFAGAFRRSELVALDVADVAFTADGVVVTVRRSKTDQEGEGRKAGIPYGSNPLTCPVRALKAWLELAGIQNGPIFRSINRHGRVQPGRLSARAVALVVKRRAGAVGRDPRGVAGHSLRSGLATAAAAVGVSERAIMAQTGHRSVTMVRRYIREGSLFRDNAAARLGL